MMKLLNHLFAAPPPLAHSGLQEAAEEGGEAYPHDVLCSL